MTLVSTCTIQHHINVFLLSNFIYNKLCTDKSLSQRDCTLQKTFFDASLYDDDSSSELFLCDAVSLIFTDSRFLMFKTVHFLEKKSQEWHTELLE